MFMNIYIYMRIYHSLTHMDVSIGPKQLENNGVMLPKFCIDIYKAMVSRKCVLLMIHLIE
jgi:hypothetical protein